jgi:transposase
VPVAALPDDVGTVAAPPMEQVAPSAELPEDTSARIEIMLPDGVAVRVGAAVDEAALRRVLAALGRR